MSRTVVIAVAAALGCLGAAQTASAADMPVKAPAYHAPVATAYDWTGAYVGGNIGYGWAGDTGAGWTSFTDPGPVAGTADYFAGGGNVLPGVKPSGVIGGVQIGYNWQVSPVWVLGVVADLQASGMKSSSVASVTPAGMPPSTQSNEAKIKWLGTARGKAGYAFNNWLAYATGGLAYGKVETNTAFNCPLCFTGPIAWAGSSSQTKTGWTIGAGLDYGLTKNWVLGVEYLYFDLGSVGTVATTSNPLGPGTSFTSNSKIRGSILRASLDYKFN